MTSPLTPTEEAAIDADAAALLADDQRAMDAADNAALAALDLPPAAPGPTSGGDALAFLNGPDVTAEVSRPPAATEGVLTSVPLNVLRESPLNPRKTFGAMATLTDSIKRIGLVQPLIVRTLDPRTSAAGGGSFEIVCGHRRYRAAREAGLDVVPVKVVVLDDVQALEAMLTENGQRENLSPIEEAETFDALRVRGWNVEQIATRLSTTPGTIYHRLKLLDLSTEAKEALADGVLPSTVAVPLARLPSAKMQAKALEVLKSRFVVDGVMNTRDAVEFLQRDFTRPLKLAPFSMTDGDLVPFRGACSTCPKNTKSATPGLFEDFRETKHPVCTDTTCFDEKAAASWKRKADAKTKKGVVVLSISEGAKLFPHGPELSTASKYVEANQINHADPKKRTWKELAERAIDSAAADFEPLVEFFAPDRDLRGHELFERSTIVKALAEQGLKWATEEVGRARSSVKSVAAAAKGPTKEEQEAAERRVTVIDLTLSAIGAAVAKKGITVAGWRALALAVATRFVSPDVLEVLDVESEKKLREKIANSDATLSIRFLFLSLLRDSDLADGDGEPVSPALVQFAKAHGVSAHDVAKSVTADGLFSKKGGKS